MDQHDDTRRVGGCAGRTVRFGQPEGTRQILDEFATVSGLHRKHAMRLLRAGQANRRFGPRPARRLYSDTTREALIVIWEASSSMRHIAVYVRILTAANIRCASTRETLPCLRQHRMTLTSLPRSVFAATRVSGASCAGR